MSGAFVMLRDSDAVARLGRVLAMFPSREQEILQLSRRDSEFRSLAEDLWDAQESLRFFLALPDAASRPEVEEYRTIIAELEAEVRHYLATKAS